MADIKKRGLESPLSQDPYPGSGTVRAEGRYIKTIGFKVTEKQYETYKGYSKYSGTDELIRKWRAGLDGIEQEKGKDMEGVETEIRKLLTK